MIQTTLTVGLLLILFLLILKNVNCQHNNNIQCRFNYSVVVTANENGSYVYENIEIPSNLVYKATVVAIYDKNNISATNESTTTIEQRACICNVVPCLPICSWNLYDAYDRLPKTEDVEATFTKNVITSENKSVQMHLVKNFHAIEKNLSTVCTYISNLRPDVDRNSDWTLFEDGRLRLDYYDVIFNYKEFCFDFTYEKYDDIYGFFVDPQVCFKPPLKWHEALTGYAMLVSVPFFLLTIFCYGCILKTTNVYQKCLIPYLSFLSISYSLLGILRVGNIELEPIPCITVGYVNTFCVMSYLVWNCILCFEIWCSCTSVIRTSSYLLWYFIVGTLVPLLMIGLIYKAQTIDIPEDYKPGISESQCSILTSRWSALIYYYGPCIVATIFSVILFCKIWGYINTSTKASKNERQMFLLSVRLFQLMCASWTCDILSYFFSMLISKDIPLFVIPDSLNATQGIVIFYLYVCQRRVSDNIKRRYSRRQSHQVSREMETLTSTSNSRRRSM
ncbi:G-protein coupled receptor Mth2-like isoform X1 [Musca autumnalis]|uniref:G-protein coupled receptor Mth2-like isoform X1 n=1 Tax=Musca autumnalis TaxID=221902 RepID=UPI003CF8ECE2